jgi:predicted permease
MRNSEIANQLNSQDLDTVLPSSIKTVGGRVFPDARSSDGLADLRDIVDSYRASHAVAYGNVVPSSGVSYAIQPDNATITDLIAPSSTEVIHLNAISFNNESATTPAEITLLVGTTIVSSQIVIPPAANSSWQDISGYNIPALVLSAGQSLKINITAGEAFKTVITASATKSCL